VVLPTTNSWERPVRRQKAIALHYPARVKVGIAQVHGVTEPPSDPSIIRGRMASGETDGLDRSQSDRSGLVKGTSQKMVLDGFFGT
jgi:hypothetical protein